MSFSIHTYFNIHTLGLGKGKYQPNILKRCMIKYFKLPISLTCLLYQAYGAHSFIKHIHSDLNEGGTLL
jgi:hypothetical protein